MGEIPGYERWNGGQDLSQSQLSLPLPLPLDIFLSRGAQRGRGAVGAREDERESKKRGVMLGGGPDDAELPSASFCNA